MCFSAEASFIAAAALSVAGVATIRMAKTKKEILFASVPFLFGIQQFIEGLLWLSFRFAWIDINIIATNIFLLFARGFWPVFFPLAILLVESVLWRRKVLVGFLLTGIVAGVYFLYLMLTHPMSSSLFNGHIVYNAEYYAPFWEIFFLFYVLATTVSALFSSHRMVRVMGVLVFISGLITYYLYLISFASIWCFFAAVLSFVVYLHFRERRLSVKKA